MSDNNNYTDNNFNLYQAYSYTLLLQLEATSFSYAVVTDSHLLVSAQNCALEELVQPRALHDLLSATYKKVIIGMPSTALTLIPSSLFNEEQVPGFARFLDVKDHEKVFAQTLDDINAIIYKTNDSLVAAIQKFGLQNTVYTAKGWIKAIAKTNPPNSNLYIEIGKDKVHFLYFSLNALRFYNTFEFKNEDELAYFTSFVTEELNLKAQQLTLVVSGDVTAGDKNLTRLAYFFPKIELNGLKVLELPGQIASHKFLALAALSLCGSSEVL
ncbi:DUF3822 family protein [Mucilaginibacter sp. BJC16-A38]|uniref:DUF3822 family protein n=1 Tax=Mucilaginibacter phenanthrenivorans TaxID=1234842 RepID=UPI0021580D85|nr:DUF3822 family protein [Mucilaginibacter phenanthrenivorans]MCR8560067.1 DUF3822 family protein [Mucilaginibacter phenanthrenivorans]